MERLMNGEIKFASKKKSGESESSDGSAYEWTLYNFTITDKEWDGIWFSYFQSGKKPIPEKGLRFDMLEYEIEEKGEYTNYTVQKLLLPEGADPKPSPKPKPKGILPGQAPKSNGGQAYINHGEVVVKLMDMAQAKEGGEIDRPIYERLLNAFKFGIRTLTTETTPPKPKLKPVEKPKPEPVEEPPPEEIDDIPF